VIYEPVHPKSRAELVEGLASNDPEQIRSSLYSASWYEEDWRWTQEHCLSFLNHPNPDVRWAAALSLGYVAQFQKHLDLDRVLPALHEAHNDPAIGFTVGDALDMIAHNIKTQ
jgi:HEAT repeat protein